METSESTEEKKFRSTSSSSRGSAVGFLTTPKLVDIVEHLIKHGATKADDVLGKTPKCDYDEVVEDLIQRKPEKARSLAENLNRIYPTSGKKTFKQWGDLLRTRNLAKHRSKDLRDRRKMLRAGKSTKTSPNILFHWGELILLSGKMNSGEFREACGFEGNGSSAPTTEENPSANEDLMDWSCFL